MKAVYYALVYLFAFAVILSQPYKFHSISQLPDLRQNESIGDLLHPENDFNKSTGITIVNKKPEIQSKIFLFERIITYTTPNKKNRAKFTYNSYCKWSEVLHEVWENEKWINYFRWTYTYDTNGNELSNLSESWVNDQWINSRRFSFTYDERGNQFSQLFEEWENGQWKIYDRTTYTYDINGNQLTRLTERFENEQWVNSSRKTKTYDTKGNLLTNLYEQFEDNQLVYSYRYTYSYDEKGNQLSELYEELVNGQLMPYYLGSMTFDTNGNLASILFQEWKNEQWTNSTRYTYIYDINWNKISYLGVRWENEKWINSITGAYTYNSNRSMLSFLSKIWKNDIWINWFQRTYTYDENNNKISYYYEKWENDTWNPFDGYETISDSVGNYTDLLCNRADIAWSQLKPVTTQLLSPQNSSMKISTEPVLEWNESLGAETYNLNVAKDEDFNNIIFSANNLSATTATLTILENGTTYYWRVKAFSDIDSSDWSDTWSFKTIMAAPALAPSLNYPENNANSITIDTLCIWEEVETAEGYIFQLSKTQNFDSSEIVINDSSLTQTSKQFSDLEYLTDYYWRVMAWNEGGYGPWSDIWKFTTEEFVSVENNNITRHIEIIPNPFSESTTIHYYPDKPALVSINIYNSFGNKICNAVNEYKDSGEQEFVFDGRNYPSGLYFYTIQVGERIESGKLVLIK